MKFAPISNTKSKQVRLNSEAISTLEVYAKYLSEKHGKEFEAADVLSSLLFDEKGLDAIEPKLKEQMARVSLKLPDAAWANLDATSERTGQKAEEVMEILAAGLLRDKAFLGWRNSSPSPT